MKLTLPVCNHKGGSGKTTTAMLLAANLSSDTYRVAVVDTDPQASAQLWAQAGEGRFPAHVVGSNADNLPAVLTSLADYDAVVIDCPPSSTAAETLAAVDVADLVVGRGRTLVHPAVSRPCASIGRAHSPHAG